MNGINSDVRRLKRALVLIKANPFMVDVPGVDIGDELAELDKNLEFQEKRLAEQSAVLKVRRLPSASPLLALY